VIRHWLFALALPGCLMLADSHAMAMPSPQAGQAPLVANAISGPVKLAQAKPEQAPPAAAPLPAPTTTNKPVGIVAKLIGNAAVIRNDATIPLKLQDDIFEGDVLQTSANSMLGVTFSDATAFCLTANAQVSVDSFVYEQGGSQNGALIYVARGTVAFAAEAVASTGDMRISTPSAKLGVGAATGLIEVPQGARSAGANHVAVKLYPDADGQVGRIDVDGRDGTRLGALTQGSSGVAIRAGAGGHFVASPLTISPQQMLRDEDIVRQVQAAQNVRHPIVSPHHGQRPPNPPGSHPVNNAASHDPAASPARSPGSHKHHALPKASGSPQQPPAPSKRAGQHRQPPPPTAGLKRQPKKLPALQPGSQGLPAPHKRRPALPPPAESKSEKGMPDKEKH
jgi:hypothetical protein